MNAELDVEMCTFAAKVKFASTAPSTSSLFVAISPKVELAEVKSSIGFHIFD